MAVFIYLGVTVNSQSPKNPTNEFFIIEMAIILKLQIHLGECLVAALFSSSFVLCQSLVHQILCNTTSRHCPNHLSIHC
jgi:hypothetical protein